MFLFIIAVNCLFIEIVTVYAFNLYNIAEAQLFARYSLRLTRNFNEIIIQRIMELDKKKISRKYRLLFNCKLRFNINMKRYSIKWMNIFSKFSKAQ